MRSETLPIYVVHVKRTIDKLSSVGQSIRNTYETRELTQTEIDRLAKVNIAESDKTCFFCCLVESSFSSQVHAAKVRFTVGLTL